MESARTPFHAEPTHYLFVRTKSSDLSVNQATVNLYHLKIDIETSLAKRIDAPGGHGCLLKTMFEEEWSNQADGFTSPLGTPFGQNIHAARL
jgi:hypothetical protein